MDPFNDVQDDCWSQIHNLEDFIRKTKYITEDAKTDFQCIRIKILMKHYKIYHKP